MFAAIAQPSIASASGLWWRPWSLPVDVAQAIPAAFEGSGTLREQTITAARNFLGWRMSQIPNSTSRATAEKFVKQAFEGTSCMGGIFFHTLEDVEARVEEIFSVFPPPIRDQVPRTLGGFRTGMKRTLSQKGTSAAATLSTWKALKAGWREFSKIRLALSCEGLVTDGGFWIHPDSINIPDGAGLATLAIHELGGHFADWRGASGFFAQAVHRFGLSPLAQFLNPIRPVTVRTIDLWAEWEAIGAEWEFWHRVPRPVRERQVEAIRREMGEHADLLEYRDAWTRVKEMRKRFAHSLETRLRFARLAQNAAALETADLPKSQYVQARGRAAGYHFWIWSHMITRTAYQRALEEGSLSFFWGPRIFEAAKMGLLIGTLLFLKK